MTPVTGLFAKGSTLRSTCDFIAETYGADALASVLAEVSASVRASVESASPTDEVDYEQLIEIWTGCDRRCGAADPMWMERAGAFSIGQRGASMYGGILRKRGPTEFLTQSVSLFQLYYHPGDMQVVEHGNGRAVLRLVGFEARTPLFCRRQTGGLAKAIEVAGGERAAARHVRCALEGDAYCEWELTWSPE